MPATITKPKVADQSPATPTAPVPIQKAEPKTKPTPAKTVEREVVYPTLQVNGCDIPEDTRRISYAMMSEMLGFEENIIGDDFFGTDRLGNKFRLSNNASNRPFDESLAKAWMTEVLKRHWELNGETIIIDRYGGFASGQHRGVGLIWAVQEWQKNERWKELWPEEPYMETLVVTGVDGSDRVLNTIDTGKPRSIADSLYRSEYLADYKKGERKDAAKILEFAVRLLWHRTGAKNDAYTPRRTHLETMDFLDRHGGAGGRLLKYVRHVYDESKGREGRNHLYGWLPPGTVAGLLYLMASSTSDATKYDPIAGDESQLKFTKEKEAKQFITLLGGKTNDMKCVRDVLNVLCAPDIDTGETARKPRREAIVVAAWNQYSLGGPMTDSKLGYTWGKTKKDFDFVESDGLKWRENSKTGAVELEEIPTCGGIDLGDPKPEPEEKPDKAEKVKTAKQQDSELAEELTQTLIRLRTDYPNQVFAFPIKDGQSMRFYGGDSAKVGKALDIKPFDWKGFPVVQVAISDMPTVIDTLRTARLVCAVVRMNPDFNARDAVPYAKYLEEPTPVGAVPTTPAEEGDESYDDPTPEQLEQRKSNAIAARSKPAPAAKPVTASKLKPPVGGKKVSALKGGTGK